MTIEIDFEVFKELTARRAAESVTYNDVLRQLLNMSVAGRSAAAEERAWTWKGVTLPSGTELKAEYKGQVHTAQIQDGRWVQQGQVYTSPSAAAFAITESGVNGWWFWSVKRPSDPSWMQLGKLRAA